MHLRVYPRTRGATLIDKAQRKQSEGLSPHARGNLSDSFLF